MNRPRISRKYDTIFETLYIENTLFTKPNQSDNTIADKRLPENNSKQSYLEPHAYTTRLTVVHINNFQTQIVHKN